MVAVPILVNAGQVVVSVVVNPVIKYVYEFVVVEIVFVGETVILKISEPKVPLWVFVIVVVVPVVVYVLVIPP